MGLLNVLIGAAIVFYGCTVLGKGSMFAILRGVVTVSLGVGVLSGDIFAIFPVLFLLAMLKYLDVILTEMGEMR